MQEEFKEKKMKIAFTSSGTTISDPMDRRFGRAVNFLVFDTDSKALSVINNDCANITQGAGIQAAEKIAKSGAIIVVTGDCGPKAFKALKQAGIKIYSSKATTVSASLEDYLSGKLKEITAA